jgi:hypothetical protein
MTFPHHELQQLPDGSQVRYSYFDAGEANLEKLLREIFEHHWQRIAVGPWVPGAIYELAFDQKPEIRISKGYATIDAGAWHFHICIGKTTGKQPAEALARRRVAKVAFYDWRGDGSVKQRSSGIRMWNGYGDQMATIFFPHVLLAEKERKIGKLNWNNLALYYDFRHRYLGEAVPEDLEAAGKAPLVAA